MGPLKRILSELNSRIDEYKRVINGIEEEYSGKLMLVSEKRGLEQAEGIVRSEYDKYYKPKCKQEQLEIEFKEEPK